MDNILYTALDAFIAHGHLSILHSCEDYSVCILLDKVHIGFIHENLSDTAAGILLTPAEFDLLCDLEYTDALRLDKLKYLSRISETLEFTDDLLICCEDLKKSKKLLKNIPEQYYLLPFYFDPYSSSSMHVESREEITDRIAASRQRIYKVSAERLKYKRIKKALTVLIIMMFVTVLMLIMLSPVFEPGYKETTEFNKRGGEDVYSSVEIDFITHLYKKKSNITGYAENYYLFGNTKTQEYGILKFAFSKDDTSLIDHTFYYRLLDEPITLYGYTKKIPDEVPVSKLKDIVSNKETSAVKSSFIPSDIDSISRPVYSYLENESAESIYIEPYNPEQIFFETLPPTLPPLPTASLDTINDYSEDAIQYFSENVFPLDKSASFGRVYINASYEQEKEQSDNYSILALSEVILLIATIPIFAVYILVFKKYKKLDKEFNKARQHLTFAL